MVKISETLTIHLLDMKQHVCQFLLAISISKL